MEDEIKVTMLGSVGVGKSSLVTVFFSNVFVEDHDPTIEDLFRKTVTDGGRSFVMEIWDIANTDYLFPLREQHMMQSQGFMFIYDITKRETFHELTKLKNTVLQGKDASTISCVVLGNKTDLEQLRKVPIEEGKKLASSFGADFFETSAKNKVNVHEAFLHLSRLIRTKFTLQNQSRRKRTRSKQKPVCVLL
eukprot:TRINITY_DN4672_c0_g3_i1.p1 TRINITY_DN4672_c0_g3~~TRINITY_DN4672_c0_g3_i1.p1  ORF type:complete len:192 (+),score=28.45 TRINITY_DN4672_c0_g3_i1:248-823(+)